MTTSVSYTLIQGFFRLTRYRNRMLKDAVRGNQRNARPRGRQAKRWQRAEFDNRAVWLCHPRNGETDRVYVHEHGGGYVYGLQSVHFMSLRELADHAGVTVILPDYPLPPQACAPEIMDWADRHFASVVECYGLENVALGGCSAGGNLALAALQMRRARGDANPETVILWSPWLDLTPFDTPPTKDEDYEALITPYGLEPAVGAYLGASDMDRADPLISPLFADLSTLPTLNIVTGQRDVLYPAISEFANKVMKAGKLGDYVAEPDYGHYWMFYPVKDRHKTLMQIAEMLS